MELFSLVPITGIALAYFRWRNTSASLATMIAVAGVILVLYLASLVGLLFPATILIVVAGTILAVFEGRYYLFSKTSPPLPVIIFAVLCSVYWLVHSGAAYYYYDEYSHWGVFLKEMLARDQLWGADTNAMHSRYLPGSSLWQYFFAVNSRNPEGAAYLAQFSLLLTPLLVLWEKISWREWHWFLGILIFVSLALSNFGHGFTSLYVDHLLGAWFAGVLLSFLFDMKRWSTWNMASYLLPVGVIVLLKSTGVFFALACAGTIALLVAVHADAGIMRQRTGARLLRVAFFPAAIVVLSLFIFVSWSANRDANTLNDTSGSTGYVASRLLAGESAWDANQQAELTRRFIDVVLHQQVSKDEVSNRYNAFSYPLMAQYTDRFRLTTASLLGLSMIAFFLVWRSYLLPEDRRNWAVAAGGTWLTAIAYIGALYLGYRYVAGSQNSFEMSSYIRYAHSMLLPVFLFSFAGLVPAFAERKTLKVAVSPNIVVRRQSIVFALALAAMIVFERPNLKPLYSAQRPPALRLQLEPLTEQVRAAIGEAKLWVFFPNNMSNGFIGQMLQYQLSPGLTHVEEDAATLLGDQAAIRKELRNWEYAWFVPQNPELDAALERLLGHSVTARVFKIDTSGAAITFEPVPNVFQVGESQRQN